MTVAPLKTKDQFTIAAARMERLAPQLWGDFKKHFEALAVEAMKVCVQAPPEKLYTMQGRAQQMAELNDIFANAIPLATRLEANMKEHSRGS